MYLSIYSYRTVFLQHDYYQNKILSETCPILQTSADSYQSDPPAGLAAQCRDRNGFWEPEVFRLLTCASCYDYLFWDLGRLVALGGWLRPVNATSPLLPADVNNATLRDVICQTLDDDGCFRWEQCCHAAEDCCTRQRRLGPWEETSYNKSHVTTGACPRTWDGYACWDDTPAGTSVFVSCPGFIPHALPGGKYCRIVLDLEKREMLIKKS